MRYLLLITVLCGYGWLFAQTSQVEFGKNRVQYHKDFESWEQYESDNFITYWYGEGRRIGRSVVQLAEYDFGYIQKMLEHRMNEKVQLIVYRDITDLKQSNIGSEDVFTLPGQQRIDRRSNYITGTQTKFLGNKAFVYYNGDHTDLRRQVREAMASVYIEHMLYGSSVQEVVQNAVLLNLPPWFKSGLVAYLGEDWNIQKDDQLRQLLLSGEYENFADLSGDYPVLAGHSFWHYIAENYGKPTVSNLLYLTRINRSVENGFLYVLGGNYENILFNWMEFYRSRYNEDLGNRLRPAATEIPIKNRKQLPVTQVKISPDGTRIAYVLNEIGRYKIFLQDLTTGQRTLVFKGGQRNLLQATDYNYPLLDFSPTNQELAILYEKRDRPRILRYDLNAGEGVTEDLDISLDRVFSMKYIDPGSMIMSASVAGRSDLFRYALNVRAAIRITDDFWDDLDATPVRIRGRLGVVFASNRQDTQLTTERLDTTLPINHFDLWYYDLDNKPGTLVRVTNTPLSDERQPVVIDSSHFGFLSDASGVVNLYRARLETYIDHYEKTIYLSTGDEITLHADSTLTGLDSLPVDSIITFPVIKERAVTAATTNLTTNIDLLASSGKRPEGVMLFRADGGQVLRAFSFDTTQSVRISPTAFRRESYVAAGQSVPVFTDPEAATTGRGELIAPNQVNSGEVPATAEEAYLFQTRFDDFVAPPTADPVPTSPVSEGDILSTEPATTEGPVPPATASPQSERPNLTVVSPGNAPIPPPGVSRNLLRSERPVAELNRTYRFINGKIKPYRLLFRVNYVKTEADNDPLFAGLNSFSGNPQGFTQQPLGLLFKGNIIDLFEDHSITGGVRVPTNFNGTEYFVTYENRLHRLDRIFSVYRRNRRVRQGSFNPLTSRQPRLIDENTLLVQYGVRYPLDIFTSLRATATVRRDRVQELPTEIAGLRNRPDNQARVGARLEYVFDNTINLGTNRLAGTRYKIYTDFYKGFNISLGGNDEGTSTGFDPGFLGIIGFDGRHYQRLDKRSILAFRVAGATNFGNQRILYYLGGADNSLLQSFNSAISTPQTGNFVFQDLANPLRGFDINTRNGGTYVLGNAELRIPVFQYFFRNLRSRFFRDFQLVSFFDIGTAWTGRDPFDEDNPANLTTYPDPSLGETGPVTIRVRRFRDPIIYGYGFGARASILGYYIRADYGWGVETNIQQRPMIHLSLGYDF